MPEYTATVTVRLKRGVLDPEAATTQRALERLEFHMEDLRMADLFEVDLSAPDRGQAHDRATAMAEGLLANPTVHDYEVSVAEREGGDAATDGGRPAASEDDGDTGADTDGGEDR
jgi:phosphoribosylformylglycinamidine synthase